MSFGKIKKILILNKIYAIWYQNDRNNISKFYWRYLLNRNRHIVSRKSHFFIVIIIKKF